MPDTEQRHNPPWHLDDLLTGSGGRLVGGRVQGALRSICCDSRKLRPGDVFVALKGDNFDGADFVEAAVNKGAAAVISARVPEGVPRVAIIQVEDALEALGRLAAYRRRQMNELTVLAVTGSSGKTTVKEMCAAILERVAPLIKTKGNFNNLIGMPLSLLPVGYGERFAVLEMGMNAPGEIAKLCRIARPDIACITNVQEAHLLGLGSVAAVAQAKGELFSEAPKEAVLVVNVDDPKVAALGVDNPRRQISFGSQEGALVRCLRLENLGEAGMTYTLEIAGERAQVRLQACGRHNVLNSLAAAALAWSAGAGMSEIVQGLESFRPEGRRFSLSEADNGLKIINDTYNANPASMAAALNTVNDMRCGRKALAILGDMLELGEAGCRLHRELGERVARQGFFHLLTIGEFAGDTVRGALDAGMAAESGQSFTAKEAMVDYVRGLLEDGFLEPGDFVLVKGSRGMRMEEVVTGLQKIS